MNVERITPVLRRYYVHMATNITAIYLRQSKDSEGNELAIDRQRDLCRKLCRERGWTNIREYPDNDRSASNGKVREKYQDMLRDIKAGKVSAVVAYHQDRLHRDVMELLVFAELAVEHGLKLATVTGDINLSTDDGEFMAVIGAALARKEVRRKSARQRLAAEQRATLEGRPWWPQRPFGFDADRDPVTGKWWTAKRNPTVFNEIRLHPTEADLLVDAYRGFLDKDEPLALNQIAKRWNAAGVRATRGGTWSGSRIRTLLLLARNAGLREFRGELLLDEKGKPKRGTWPQIVSEETWRQAVAEIKRPDRLTGPRAARKYLLSGIALCGVCGAAMTSHISARGKRQYACFRTDCRKILRDGFRVDEIIVSTVVGRLSQDDAIDLLVTDKKEVDANALREERKDLNDSLKRLGRDFAKAPAAFRQSALDEIQTRLAAIEDDLNDSVKANIYEGVIGADDVAKAFDDLSLARQRAIVNALMVLTILPVGKGTGRFFDPNAIDVVWK
jgi:DNA invertase Pin-like site-specific DNA recombinase